MTSPSPSDFAIRAGGKLPGTLLARCRCGFETTDAEQFTAHTRDEHPEVAARSTPPPGSITDRDLWDRLIQANSLLELERISAWRVAEEVCAVADSLDVWAQETPDEMLRDALGEAVSRLRRAAKRTNPRADL